MLLNGEEHLLRTCSSVLGNVMTWDLTVPSHYQINIDWYIIKEVLWHLSLGIFTWKDISIMKICRKITHSWLATSSSGQSIKIFTPLIPCPWFIYKIIISKLTFNSKWLYCGLWRRSKYHCKSPKQYPSSHFISSRYLGQIEGFLLSFKLFHIDAWHRFNKCSSWFVFPLLRSRCLSAFLKLLLQGLTTSRGSNILRAPKNGWYLFDSNFNLYKEKIMIVNP